MYVNIFIDGKATYRIYKFLFPLKKKFVAEKNV
jgi:hypothetical protein